MTHDAIALAMLTVMLFAPMLYGAVFCRSERPMKRLVKWTEAVSEIVVAAIKSLLHM
jgi:hypothetical protein